MPETSDAQQQAQNPAAAAMHAKFEQGFALHQQGKLAEAERIYREILQEQPNHLAALYWLAIIARKTRHTKRAIDLFERAIALKPDFAEAYCNRGLAQQDLMRLEDALASYDKAIALKPDFAEAYSNRGLVLLDLKRPEGALTSYDKAIALKPDLAEAYCNRGLALQDLKRFEDAQANYDKAIALKPDFAEAHNNRGNALNRLKRSQDALASYDKAIELKPDFAMAHNNRGIALLAVNRPADALASCDKAIALKPSLAMAHNNRGLALEELNRPEEALTSYDRAIALEPGLAEVHNNRGNVLRDLKRSAESLASFDRALALDPDYAGAYLNQGFCLLLMGRLDRGFRQYEWRKKRDDPVAIRPFPRPLWLGEENIAGKSLFLWWEQGLGDTIHFCRYAKLAEARGAKVIMSVQRPLRRLLAPISPTIEIIDQDEVPAQFDYHCPLLSLPLAFGTTLATIPARQPYLKADEELRNVWSARLPPATRPRIGLVWSGRTDHKNNRNRSMELERLLPILGPDADWICLHKEVRDNDLAVLRQFGRIVFFGEELRDFGDTAALLDLMDLVITIDTSVAHLAGAMGKPVWILLPYNSDWRWMLDRDDSPWYPSAKLFRQQRIGTWAGVIDQVGNELRSVRSNARNR
jgi:tetratricopeptide (TPR) repeat protein